MIVQIWSLTVIKYGVVTITKFWEVCKNTDPNLKTASTTLKKFFLNVGEGKLRSQHLELPSGVSRASENVLQNTDKIEMMHLGILVRHQ